MAAEFSDRVVTIFDADVTKLVAGLNKAVSAYNDAQRGMNNVGGPVVQRNIQQTSRATQQFGRSLQTTGREINNTSTLMKEVHTQTGAATTSFRRAAMSIQTNIPALDLLSLRLDRASMMMWKFTMAGVSMQQLATVTGAVAVGFGMMLKEMIGASSNIDRVTKQFTNIYGSSEMAKDTVANLQNAATTIRYTVQEVMESGRMLAVVGFDPNKLINDMADMAAGVNREGITIEDATRAFVQATNGNFRRLINTFQITRADAMKFDPFAFAGPNNQISNKARATEAILKAMGEKYSGMNAATMSTIQGQWSNLKDAIQNSMAVAGEAIRPTITEWIGSFRKFFGTIKTPLQEATGLIKFFSSGTGKVVSQTILWATVLSAAATGVALLAAGLTSLLGVFAAYKVFVGTREKGVMSILKAEVALMGVTQQIAEFEAMRNTQDIEGLTAKLALSKAIYNEEQKRLSLMGVPLPGGDKNPLATRSMADLTGVRRQAQAKVDMLVKPRELLGINDNMETVQEEIRTIEQTTLGVESERYAVLKKQETVMLRQQAIMEAQIADARAIAGGGAGGAADRVMAQHAQADADALAATAAEEEALATELQTQADQLQLNVQNLQTQQTMLDTAATEANTAAKEANAIAEIANAESKAAAFRYSEKNKIVNKLGEAKDVTRYGIHTEKLAAELERDRSKLVRDVEQGKVSEENKRISELDLKERAHTIEQRKQRLPQMQSQEAIRIRHTEELGALEKDMQLKKQAADAAAKTRRDTAASARENGRALKDTNSDLTKQNRELDKVNKSLQTQRKVAGDAQAEAAAAQGRATGMAGGLAGGVVPGTAAPRNVAGINSLRYGQEQAILRMVIQQGEAEANSLAILLQQGGATAAETVEMENQLAVAEAQLDVDRKRLAAVDARALAAKTEAITTTVSFGSGFGAGFKGIFAGLAAAVAPVVNLFSGLWSGLTAAVAAAGSVAAAIGVVVGALAALAAIAVVITGAWYLLVRPAQKASHALDDAGNSATDFAKKVKRAIDMMGIAPSAATGANETAYFIANLQKYSKEVAIYQQGGEAIRPMEFAKRKLGMDDAAAANFARMFWKYWDDDMRKTVPAYAKSPVGQSISKIVQTAGGWENVTPEQMKEIEKAMTGGPLGTAAGTGSPAEWRSRLARIAGTVQGEQSKQPSAAVIKAQQDAADAQIEDIRQIANQEDQVTAEKQLQEKYGFGTVAAANEFLRTADASTDKVGVLNDEMQNMFKTAQDAIPEVQSIDDLMADMVDNGKDNATVQNELNTTYDFAAHKLTGMKAAAANLYDIDVAHRAERKKAIADMQKQLDILLAQRDVGAEILRSVANNAATSGIAGAAGVKGIEGVLGGQDAQNLWKMAQATKDPKEKQRLLEQATKAANAAIEQPAGTATDLAQIGPNATPEEKMAYERQAAAIAKRKQEQRDKYLWPFLMEEAKKNGASPAQLAGMEEIHKAEQHQTDISVAESGRKVSDIGFGNEVAKKTAARAGAAISGASPQQLAKLDLDILRTKMQQAIANNQITEQMQLQVEAAQVLKVLGESVLSTEQAKLNYMQTQADQGIIPQEAVDAEKRKMAQMYMGIAQQAGYGTEAYFTNMNNALQLLNDDAQKGTDKIIGDILGAPATLISNIVSEGGLARRFGSVGDMLGLSGKMQAEIVSQSNRELLVRVNFDSALQSVDDRIKSVMPSAINAMGQQLVGALSA